MNNCFNLMHYPLLSTYVFTKLTKPMNTYLRNYNVVLSYYLNDSLYFANSEAQCKEKVKLVCDLLQNLGFIVNYDKCVLVSIKIARES